MVNKRIQHGFSIANILILALLLLAIYGIRWVSIIVPQVMMTADKVASLNNLQSVDVHGKVAGCIRLDLTGTV